MSERKTAENYVKSFLFAIHSSADSLDSDDFVKQFLCFDDTFSISSLIEVNAARLSILSLRPMI